MGLDETQNIDDNFQRAANPYLAQNNIKFKQAYRGLLLENDRVIHMDWHLDMAGSRFLASEDNMRLMSKNGYEYLMLELPQSLNPIVEKFEQGLLSNDELAEKMAITMIKENILLDEKRMSHGARPNNPYLNPESPSRESIEAAKQYYKYNIDAVINAKEYGIAVRFFDDWQVMFDDDIGDNNNAHISNPVFKRDTLFDEFIENATGGKKAVILTGGGHTKTDYGLDEYMQDRGYKVGTFQLHKELSSNNRNVAQLKYNVSTNTSDDCLKAEAETQFTRRSASWLDDADTNPDLVYDERNGKMFSGQQLPEIQRCLEAETIGGAVLAHSKGI